MRKMCVIQLDLDNLLEPDFSKEDELLKMMAWWVNDLNIVNVEKSAVYRILNGEDNDSNQTEWFGLDLALSVLKEINTAIVKLNDKLKGFPSISSEGKTELQLTIGRLRDFSGKWTRYVVERLKNGGDYTSNYKRGVK